MGVEEGRPTFRGDDESSVRRSGTPPAYLNRDDPAALQSLHQRSAPERGPASPGPQPQRTVKPRQIVEHTHALCRRCNVDTHRLELQAQLIFIVKTKLRKHERDEAEAIHILDDLNLEMDEVLAQTKFERLKQELAEL